MDWGTAISLLAVLLLAAPAPSHGDVALPGDLSPVAYVLEINPYLATDPTYDDNTFDGTVQITVVPSKATVNVTLHKDAALSVKEISVQDAATNQTLSVTGRDTSETDLLTITLSESLQIGSQYRVTISFAGIIGRRQSNRMEYNGFYSVKYTGDEGIDHYILGTHFSPNFARKVFPCFDEPQYVATFDITVSRTSHQTALANTGLTGSQGPDPSFRNRTRDTFAQTPAIAPYQVAILVVDSDFMQSRTGAEMNVHLHARSQRISNTAFAEELIPNLLGALESYTGQGFPLQKLDVVAVPEYMVPFEHFYGTIVFREGYLLMSDETSAKFEFIIASAIAREVALTWFGNTIHLNSWADAWLTEGLVEYLQYVILDKATNGKYDAISRIGADDVHKGLLDDAEETTKALDSGDYADPQQQLTGLKLTKGAGLFHMLSALLGDTAFQKGLQQYINLSKNAAASSTNLINALQQAADGVLPGSVTVQSVVDSWITTPGYPLLTVTGTSDKVTVTQSRFLSHTDTGLTAEQWIVPFTVRAANDSTPKSFTSVLNGANSADVSLDGVGSGDAYVLNWGQSGFYRVNYDNANWEALVTSMSGLDTASRAALIDDAFALSQAGLVDVLTPLKLLENNLPAETSPAPWLAAYRAINKWRTLLRAEPEADKLFTLYVRDIILKPAYDGVGWDTNDDDSVNYKTVRGFVTELACAFEGIDCQRTALTIYIAHGVEPNYFADVSGDVLAAVICEGLNAIPVGSNVTAAQSLYLFVEDESRRLSAIRGMGCSKDTSLITSAVIDNFFTYEYYSNMGSLFEALTDYSRTGVTDVIGYLETYYAKLQRGIGDDETNAIIKYVIERISTEEQLKSMDGFLGKHGLNVSSPALVNAMLDATQNVQWVQQTALPQITAYARTQLGMTSQPTPAPQPTPTPGPLSTPVPPSQPPAPGPSDPPGVEDAWHLPTSLQPQHYQLSITPYIQEVSPTSSFNGTVTITLLVLMATDTIEMHAAASLGVEVLSVLDSTGKEVASSYPYHRDMEKEFLAIALPSNLTLGSVYTVSLSFLGQLLKDNEGFYLSSYSLVNETLGSSVTKFIATTQFEPTWARKAFPCFDEPRFKSTFDITVGKLKSQSAISNMPVKSTATDPQDANRDLVTFETTPPMSSYLVAFIVSELKEVPTTDKRISVFVREDAVDQVTFVVDLAPQILQEMERFTGMTYALPKLSLVAIPDFEAGAMENWGCITFRENRMLVQTSGEAPDRERSVAEVVAHEFTHLWFGDLVTVAEWSSLWQQEGMASLFQRYILDKATNGKYSALSWLEVEEVQDALAVDALENAEPLTNTSLTSPTALNDHMGTITYSKGAGFLHMIMDFIGESTFRKGLQKYLKENEYGWGTPENLGSALQEAVTEDGVDLSGVTMAEFITSWTEKPGYPLITVSQDPVNNEIKISQKRYLQHEAFDPSASQSTWIVPITFTITDGSSSGTVVKTVLTETGGNYTYTSADVTRDTYILVNENQAGFYRVNYDSRTWLVLAQALSLRQVVQPALRAAILDDVLTLARSGEVESWVAFFVMQSLLKVETEPIVWVTAKKHMLHYAALCTHNREMRSFFNTYLEQVVTAQTYSELGWTSPWAFQDESQDLRYSRGLVSQLGCFADGILCTGPAYVDFIKWRDSPSSLRPEMVSAALCTGLANSEVDDVVNTITAYTTETDRSLRFAYVYALGCIKDNTKITSLLDSVITGVGVEPQEVNDLLISIIANSDNGVEFPLAYLTDRFPKIVSSKGLEYAAQLLQVIAERAYLPSQVAKIEYLESQYPSLDLVVAIRSAEQSVRWASGSAEFAEWIATQIGTDTSPVPAPQHTPTGPNGLPDSVSPQDYTITFGTQTQNGTDYDEQYIPASVKILVSVTEDTDSVTMHAASNLLLGNITVTDSQSNEVAVISTSVYGAYEQVTLYLDSPLKAGQQYTISILFDIEQIANTNRVQPISLYGTIQMFDFSMGNARRLVPCFDEPRFRSTFTVSVSTSNYDSTYIAQASCSPIASTSTENMSEMNTFRTTSPMPIQSLGVFVDTDGSIGSYKSSDVDVTFYGTATSIAQEQLVSRALGAVFTYLEAVTGKGSDLQGLNLVSEDSSVSGYLGGSFWGLYVFSNNIFNLADPSPSSLSYKTWYTTVTKDLAQHWFGGLIAMDWWNNPWFGSGFSSYFSYLVGTQLDMAWQFDILFVLEPLAAALREEAYESAQPLVLQDVEPTADAIYSSYKGNTRNKGAAFVNSLMHIVGPDNVKGLKEFFLENSYSATNPSKLFSTLEKNIIASNNVLPEGVSLEEVVKTWTDQPGYPVVTIIRDYNTGDLSFTQERFLAHTPSAGVDTSGAWWVPLSFTVGPDSFDTYAADLVIQGWVGPNTTSTTTLKSQSNARTYIIFNTGRADLYRANYDYWNWIIICSYIADTADGYAALTPRMARPVLVQDTLALARVGRLEYILALKVVDFLRVATYADAWVAAREVFNDDLAPFLLETAAEAPYKFWVYGMLYTIMRTVGYSSKPSDAPTDSLLRSVVAVWCVEAGDDEVVALALEGYAKWMNNTNSVATDTLAAAMCAGAMSATTQELNFIFNTFSTGEETDSTGKETDPTRRAAIIEGMGCITNSTVAEKFLKMTVSTSDFSADEAVQVLKSVTRFGPSKVTLALTFIHDNLERIIPAFGKENLVSALVNIAVRTTTQEQYDMLNAIVKSLGSPSNLRSSLLLAKDNLGWQDTYLELVTNWLTILGDSQFPDTTSTTTTSEPSGSTISGNPPTNPPTEPVSPFTLPTGPSTPMPTLKPLTQPTNSPQPTSPPQPATTAQPSGAPALAATAALLAVSILVGLAV